MRKLFLLIAIIAMASNGFAQQPIRDCGTTGYMNELFQQDPGYKIRLQQIEEFTQNWIKNNPEGTRTVVTIPVVVHVVHNNATENISDAQVLSNIDVLNEDFRRLNADASSTPAAFQGVAADCEIEFCMAARDPNGNATNGITRTSTTKTSFTTNNNVKFNSQGGENAWDRNSYLNIWVCDLSGFTIGYAQFPGGPANTDGVVIDHTAYGTTGTAAFPFNKGRTATHEVGHWLNLFHIWGDDGTGCFGSDQVADTPNQADETYNCPLPTIRISCSNGPNGDMYMNYMDYVNDACMNLFTLGQKSRMQALFAPGASRDDIVNSQGCVPPGGVQCIIPAGLNATAITENSATLNWNAATGALTYNIQYKPTSSGTWINTTSSTTSKAITGLTPSTLYEFQVQSDCGGGTLSAFSSSTNFTTSAATCVDAFEPNNSKGAAKTIPVGSPIQAKIGTSTDKDFFKFTNTAGSPNMKVTLSNLPEDYELDFYNTAGTKIASSQNAGLDNEEIIINTSTVGTYKVRVYGFGGVFNNSLCYTLLAETSSSPFRLLNGDAGVTVNHIENIFPNPSKGNFTVEYSSSVAADVQLFAYDMMGRVIHNVQDQAVEGLNTYSVNLSDLASGIYVFVVQNGAETSHLKFTIE